MTARRLGRFTSRVEAVRQALRERRYVCVFVPDADTLARWKVALGDAAAGVEFVVLGLKPTEEAK